MFLYNQFLYDRLLIVFHTIFWPLAPFPNRFNYQNKEYAFIGDDVTFDEAVEICKGHGQRLVEIKSQGEQDFVFNTIVKPEAESVWLGASNNYEATTYKWLSDGSDVVYTNWRTSLPSNQHVRNVIRMRYTDGKWWDMSVREKANVICERANNWIREE